MPLIWDDDTIRLELKSDPGEWVELKRELSSGDDDAVFEAMIATDAMPVEQDVRVSLRVTAINRERIRRSIVAWSYVHQGKPVPVTPRNIDRLSRTTYEEIVDKVDELNPFEIRPPKIGITAPTSPGSADSGESLPPE